MSLSEIQKLSIAERLELVEDIWDSIALDSQSLSLTDEEKNILDERFDELNNSTQRGGAWKAAKARIESRL